VAKYCTATGLHALTNIPYADTGDEPSQADALPAFCHSGPSTVSLNDRSVDSSNSHAVRP